MTSKLVLRGRKVCMIHGDWMDFGYALQEAFPTAAYYRDHDPINRAEDRAQTPEPPEFMMVSHLLDTSSHARDRVEMIFDPLWRAKFKRISTEIGRQPEDWQWGYAAAPPPTATFRLGGHIYKEPVPYPMEGYITFYAEKGNKEHAALSSRFFRTLGKFTTNKKNLVRVRVPSLEVTVPVDAGSDTWCGHHAIEWARQNPDGVLFYNRAGFGIRPTGKVMPFAGKKTASGG